MPKLVLRLDPRWFQVVFQAIFLAYGIIFLNWSADWLHYVMSIAGCLAFQYTAESWQAGKFLKLNEFPRWGFSVLISAMSLCLLLKSNYWQVSLLAAFFSVAGKYVFRVDGRHIFNPSAFGIVAVLLLSGDAWLSPGQWGSNAVIFFLVITLGTIVITRVQRLDISFAFLLTYIGLLFWRQVIYLNWPMDFFFHSVTTGSLLLFTFFMISDPKTAPNHPAARIIWAMLIAVIAFYLAAFKWQYNTIIWVLVAAAPLVPLLNRLFKGQFFEWKAGIIYSNPIHKIKKTIMKPFMKKLAALIVLVSMLGYEASAFCGFYVAKADGTLKNKTSEVILVRDGNRNVITMFNDFKGNLKDFAMVVPVPVVLQKKDIKVVDQRIFQVLNDYSKPRLVEYWDQNPCVSSYRDQALQGNASRMDTKEVVVTGSGVQRKHAVKIEAQYIVGEYDILILSAKESAGLKDWLLENGYKIPSGAEEVLEPYIKSNLKFFVVKVNMEAKKKIPGDFLRPIQISFNSPKFMLPIRLGMANADGDQDMIIYAFTKKGRIESTNYRTVSVPTGKHIPLFVQQNFGAFYSNLFQHQWNREGRSIAMLEYAWDVSPKNYVKCDPCVSTPPGPQDLVQAGVWWLQKDWTKYDDVYNDDDEDYSTDVHFTRLHVRYNRRQFPQDLVFQITPNKESYQARYIITHPATGSFDCTEGKKYLRTLKERRKNELEQLSYLTGKNYDNWDMAYEDEKLPGEEAGYGLPTIANFPAREKNEAVPGIVALLLAGLGIMFVRRRR